MKHTDKRCRNCSQHLLMHQRYCHQCGQKTDTHRINFHFLVHEVQHGIFHVDGGILFTLRELFTRPGHAIREYIEGRRKPHFPPMMLVLIMGSVCALTQYALKHETKEEKEEITSSKIEKTGLANYVDFEGLIAYFKHVYEWLSGHFAFAVLLMLPVAAFGFFLGFRKYKLNYPEWLVILLFLAGQSLGVYVAFIIINNFFGNHNGWFFLISWSLVTFSLVQFFSEHGRKYVILRTVWSIMLTYFLSFFYLMVAIFQVTIVGFILYGYETFLPKLMQKL